MKIALLTAGPSLREFWCDEFALEYDRVIAVNGAAFFFACDYFAFIDRIFWESIQSGQVAWPKRGFITHENYPLPAGYERLKLPLYQARFGRVPKALADAQCVTECGYTFPSALMAARDMAEGGKIDLFGFDYTPELNISAKLLIGAEGHLDPSGYSAGRWGRELPWVKVAWAPSITVFGKAHPLIIAWLRGEATETEALATLQ